jgi:hypothetical protein
MVPMKLVVLFLVLVTMACGEVVDPPDPDPCATGTCECAVATEDTDCAAHEYCNATDAGRTCECVAGYTDGINGCVWTGSVQDPGLAMSAVWTPVNGALLNSTAPGMVDPGEASFLPSALCSLAHVKQSVEMPTFAKAEPLVLELTYKNQRDIQQSFDQVLMGVSFGGNWSPFPFFTDALFHSMRICLPEGAYAPSGTAGRGAPVTFALGPYQQPDRCPSSTLSNFAVDHAAIVAANAGECGTTFGQGVNFDAEGTGGFTFTVSGGSSGNFVAGAGANGTRGARLTLAARCESARMETMINVPDVPNPAFEMFVSAGPNANPFLQFGNTLISTSVFSSVSAATRTKTFHMCMPPSMRGQTLSLGLSLSGGAGTCGQVLNLQTTVDNIRVVDDPACASTDSFTDLGFEQADEPWGTFGTASSSTAAAIIRSTAGQAHGGTRYLALESYGRCSSSGYTMMPIVPAPSGAAGPALKFFANVGVNPDAATFVSARGGTASQTLTEGGGYRPYTVCLSPVYQGRPQQVFLRHDGGSGLCDNSNYVQQNALIDDIEVTTDPLCPVQ